MNSPQSNSWTVQQHTIVSGDLLVEIWEQRDVDISQASSLTKHKKIHEHKHSASSSVREITAFEIISQYCKHNTLWGQSFTKGSLKFYFRDWIENAQWSEPCTVCRLLNNYYTDCTFRGVLIHARWVKWESTDTPTTSQLTSWNSLALSLNAMISVGHTNVLWCNKK